VETQKKQEGGAATAGMVMPKKEHVISTRGPETARSNRTMNHRWPKSIHSQVEAIFHSIRSFREAKTDKPLGLRSFGSWKVYKYEAHRFAEFILALGMITLLDTLSVRNAMTEYLEERLASLETSHFRLRETLTYTRG
jgi:hypothetical protein